MPDSRTLVLAAIVASLIGTTARGDGILKLGVFSSDPALSTPNTGWDAGGSSWGWQPAPIANPAPIAPPIVPAALTPASPPIVNAPASPAPPTRYDAFINLGSGSYPNSGWLTTGNALPWYDSPKIVGLFGGQPNAQQQASFDSTVLQRVQQTFQISGVPVRLTDDPNATAAHTLSVVSNAVNPSMNSAIGMTGLGTDGFHFIDNSAPHAQSVDQLEWIVAHNVAHELMLAFGVPENYDQSGKFIDSTAGQIAMFLNPNSTFSPGAVQALLSENFQTVGGGTYLAGAQLVDPSPVPEPTTWAIWALGALATSEARRRARSRRVSA